MKALIFGIRGQDGFYLNRLLRDKNIDVIGTSRTGNDVNGNVAHYKFVEALIKIHQPDYVFHFAANSTTNHYALFENHETISTGTLNILEAVRLHCPNARVFLSGSAMQFLNIGIPINELTPFEASSPYSFSRIQSVYTGRYFRDKFGLKVYVGYFFNHDSPLRGENHVNQKIVKAVRRISKGSNEILKLGDLNVKKEFGFAGDTIEATWTLVNQDKIFEAVIGTGKAYSIEDWTIACFDQAGIDWKKHVVPDPSFIPQYKILISQPNIINNLGWKPKVDFKKLMELMMLTN